MEEFIQILVFVGAMVIAVIGQNAKNKKKPTTASPQEVLEDMFPEITVQGEETVVNPPKPSAPIRRKTAIKSPSVSSAKPSVQQKGTTEKSKKISLSSKEEARRAFIHSEIFNRKYS
jgi:hypothetical protein